MKAVIAVVFFAALACGYSPDVGAKSAAPIFENAPVFQPIVQRSELGAVTAKAQFRPAMVLAPLEENYNQQATHYVIQHVVETQTLPLIQPIEQDIERHATPVQNTIIERIVQPVVNEQTTARLTAQVREGKASQPIMNAPITQEMTLPTVHQSETLPVLDVKNFAQGALSAGSSSGVSGGAAPSAVMGDTGSDLEGVAATDAPADPPCPAGQLECEQSSECYWNYTLGACIHCTPGQCGTGVVPCPAGQLECEQSATCHWNYTYGACVPCTPGQC